MDPKSRQVFLPILAFLIPLAVLLPNNLSLQKKNADLIEQSKKLQVSLDTVEERYKVILEASDKDKKTLRESLDSIRRENESIQFALKKSQTQMETAIDEKTYLEEMLIHKTKEIESIRSGRPMPVSSSVDAANITDRIRSKDEEIRRLSDENQSLSVKLDKLYNMTNTKIAEINVAKIALEDTVSSARQNISEEWNAVNLGTIQVDKEKNSASKGGKTAPSPAPAAAAEKLSFRKEARVLALNEEHGFLVIDAGKVDNISMNSRFEVKKGGQTIASLSVLEIKDVMTACNIRDLRDGQKIQINDLVSILQ